MHAGPLLERTAFQPPAPGFSWFYHTDDDWWLLYHGDRMTSLRISRLAEDDFILTLDGEAVTKTSTLEEAALIANVIARHCAPCLD